MTQAHNINNILDRLDREIDQVGTDIETMLNRGDESAAAAMVVRVAHLEDQRLELISILEEEEQHPTLEWLDTVSFEQAHGAPRIS